MGWGRDQSESGTAVTVVFIIYLFVLDMNNRRASPGHKTKFNVGEEGADVRYVRLLY